MVLTSFGKSFKTIKNEPETILHTCITVSANYFFSHWRNDPVLNELPTLQRKN